MLTLPPAHRKRKEKRQISSLVTRSIQNIEGRGNRYSLRSPARGKSRGEEEGTKGYYDIILDPRSREKEGTTILRDAGGGRDVLCFVVKQLAI